MLIDTHCHLNFFDHFPNPAAAITLAKIAGVEKMIAVGCDTETSRAAVDLADRFEEIYAVVGWHPTYTKDYTRASLDEVADMLTHPKAVALGEIGLDFHWDTSTPEEQYEALHQQLDLAERLDKPVVFHCRKAYPELLDVLEKRRSNSWLFHCFSGSRQDAGRAIALGAYFGVDGPVTYKNSQDLRETLKLVPKERLVVETDSPYLPPAPFRGKPNTPAYVAYVNAGLAVTLEMTTEECARLTTANAQRFFRL